MMGCITYEHESHSGMTYTFEVRYTAYKAERATGPSYASGGEPGYPAHAEWSVEKCVLIMVTDSREPETTYSTMTEMQILAEGSSDALCKWFSSLVNADAQLRRRINELCLEDASERDESAKCEAADAKREEIREMEWR